VNVISYYLIRPTMVKSKNALVQEAIEAGTQEVAGSLNTQLGENLITVTPFSGTTLAAKVPKKSIERSSRVILSSQKSGPRG